MTVHFGEYLPVSLMADAVEIYLSADFLQEAIGVTFKIHSYWASSIARGPKYQITNT